MNLQSKGILNCGCVLQIQFLSGCEPTDESSLMILRTLLALSWSSPTEPITITNRCRLLYYTSDAADQGTHMFVCMDVKDDHQSMFASRIRPSQLENAQ
jgi:hypothetical protein